jgi:hypothetical protein
MDKNNQITGGLLPLKEDKRDFTLGGIYGKRDMSLVPDYDFVVGNPIKIKNQFVSDFCTAFAGTAVSEDQEKIELSPEYLFAKEKELIGNYKSWGCDLRTACKALVNYGCIEKELSPYDLLNQERDFIANPRNWDKVFDKDATKHKKKSYFAVDIQGDIFDSFRSAMWENIDQKCSILTGCVWEREWTDAEGGIIPEKIGTPVEGHAFKIFGQKNIAGQLYLVAQLSNGDEIGDKGIFYFSREVVNRVFKSFGAFMFIDEDSGYYKKNHWTFSQKILNIFKKIFRQ